MTNIAVNIYPNPATNVLNISLTKEVFDLHMIDMNGKLVHSIANISEQTQLSVSDLQPGIYIVRLSNEEEIKTFKVVIGN